MNNKLYKIIVLYGAPKDSHTSTEEYIIAKDDKEVFEYIAKDKKKYEWWEDDFESGGQFDTFAEMKQEIMDNKGDLDSEEGWEDAYYGVTKYGWEEIGEISQDEINILIKLKILNIK